MIVKNINLVVGLGLTSLYSKYYLRSLVKDKQAHILDTGDGLSLLVNKTKKQKGCDLYYQKKDVTHRFNRQIKLTYFLPFGKSKPFSIANTLLKSFQAFMSGSKNAGKVLLLKRRPFRYKRSAFGFETTGSISRLRKRQGCYAARAAIGVSTKRVWLLVAGKTKTKKGCLKALVSIKKVKIFAGIRHKNFSRAAFIKRRYLRANAKCVFEKTVLSTKPG